MSAGRQSREHAIASAAALEPAALESLHAEAVRLVRAYYTTSSAILLADLISLRDTVYVQLKRTNKPLQLADLYLIAGQACGLLASVSWDLGHPDFAEEQAQAVYMYGSLIDHRGLQAWARALQTTVAFWSDRPREAAKIAAEALPTAPAGTARARLHAVRARALALLGARQEVDVALALSAEELERAGGGWADEVGGELAFDRSRRGLCAGAAYVALGDGDSAEVEAVRALELFGRVDAAERWAAGELGARVDLGTARAMRGDLAGAQDALASVFVLEPERRTEALNRRLLSLGRMLGAPRYRGAVEARDLGGRVEEFSAGALARTSARPAITAGP